MRPFKKIISLSIVLMLVIAQMSIIVLSAQDNTALSFTVQMQNDVMIRISENQPTEEETKKYYELISKTASPPFYALIRDYPDITCWMNKLNVNVTSEIYGTSGTNLYLRLSSLKYDLHIHDNYPDPKGMAEQIRYAVDRFTPSGDTMYEKLISIHDYVCALTTYRSDTDGALYCYSAYGALVNRQAVCEGYAEAFKLLCDKNGIDCILVTGNAVTSGKAEAHMWNYVRMDDGEWYAVDTTWDDALDIKNNYSYFLIGKNTAANGTLFESSHIPTYDFSGMEIEGFQYPELSNNAYDPNGVKQEYDYGEGYRYYYSSLNDAQKEIYNAMYAAIVNGIPSYPDKTPSPAPTDDIFPPETSPEDTSSEEETTSPEDTSSEEETTSPEDTSSDEETTSPEDTSSEEQTTSPEDTSSEEQTTSPEDTSSEEETTSPEDTSSEEETTSPEDTSSDEETTSPEDTSSEEETTSPEDTSSEEETTSPEDTSSEEETTSPEDTSSEEETTSPEDTSSEEETTSPEDTSSEEETTSIEDTSSEEETTSPEDTSSEEETTSTEDTSSEEVTTSTEDTSSEKDTTTHESTVTTQNETIVSSSSKITTPNKISSGYNKYDVMYDIVKVAVIISAIACLGLVLGILIIKFAKKHTNEE